MYVGSAESCEYDQVLEEFIIDELPPGKHINTKIKTWIGEICFKVCSASPEYKKIPYPDDLLAASIVMISATYRNQEFFRYIWVYKRRCSYFVFNSYENPDWIEKPPKDVQIDNLHRFLLIDKPRIKKTEIIWDDFFDIKVQKKLQTSKSPKLKKDKKQQYEVEIKRYDSNKKETPNSKKNTELGLTNNKGNFPSKTSFKGNFGL